MAERWWVIHEDELYAALHRCELGETADIMLIELTANSEIHQEGNNDG